MIPGFSNFNFEGTNAGNESECSFNSGSSFPAADRTASLPAVRRRPRLAKVRKPHHSRSSMPTVDFNPFLSGSDRSTDDFSATNGFCNSGSGSHKLGESQNTVFVFCSSRSDNSADGDSIGNICGVKTDDRNECLNSDNLGYVFGPRITCSSYMSGKEAGSQTKLVSDDKLNYNGLDSIVDAYDSDSISSLSSENGGSGGNVEHFVGVDEDRVELGCRRENEKFDSLGFVFCARSNKSAENSTIEKNFVKNTVQKLPPEDEGRETICSRSQSKEHVEVESQKSEQVGAVFKDNGIHSAENISLEKEEFIDNVGKSVSEGLHKTIFVSKAGCERKKADNVSFDVDSRGSLNTNGGQNQGAFSFGGDSVRSSYQGRTAAKILHEMKGENIGDHGGTVKDKRYNAGSVETCSEVKFSNELKKLHISTHEKGGLHDAARPSNKREDTDANYFFVFSSGNEDCGEQRDDSCSSSGNFREETHQVPLMNDPAGFSSYQSSTSPRKLSNSSKEDQFSEGLENGVMKLNVDVGQSSFLPCNLDSKPNCGTNSTCVEEIKVEFSFANSSHGSGASFIGSKNPLSDTSMSFSVNLSCGLNQKLESGEKTGVTKGNKMNKKKGKLRQSNKAKLQSVGESLPNKITSQVGEDCFECYSPMDFSPYLDPSATEELTKETSATPNDSSLLENNCAPFDGHYATVSAERKDDIVFDAYSQSRPFCMNSPGDVASGNTGVSISSNMSVECNERTQFSFASNSVDRSEKLFAFTATTSGQAQVSLSKRQGKKKNRMKIGGVSGVTSIIQEEPLDGSENEHTIIPESKEKHKSMADESNEKHKSIADEEQGPLSVLTTAEKTCAEWRLRGNQSYKDGELSKAEDFYSRGINCIPSGVMSGFSLEPLVRCYSNRAATRMALGKVREALQDCLVAVMFDPDFLKARIRAANCHLMLGELENAMQTFDKCLKSEHDVCLDRQVVIAASDGLQKAQKVMEYTNRSSELLKHGTSEAATTAFGLISEAMLISLYSEKLLEMKAKALCMLRRYEEAIQLCHQTLDFAEKNFISMLPENFMASGSDSQDSLNVRLWRQNILSKCYFHLGMLEAALDVLEKQECGNKTQESSHPLAVAIHNLLKHKNAGNEAFQSGNHAEAVDYYTSAILSSMESRPFAAICFCNRAAAHQALGQIADAIADCSLAIALDKNYAKAVSRRATLHQMIRDYKQAASDLQRLVSILEKQSHEREKLSGSKDEKELRQTYQRLSLMESESKKGIPLDLYLILGIKRSAPSSEIKKAYRKAALRHHPDKAAQALVRSESGDDGLILKDIADLVHEGSDKLFKMIVEAYSVLSDTEKRSEYDLKEDMRNAPKESNNGSATSRRQSDAYTYSFYPFERSPSRRYTTDSYYRTYNDRYTRW